MRWVISFSCFIFLFIPCISHSFEGIRIKPIVVIDKDVLKLKHIASSQIKKEIWDKIKDISLIDMHNFPTSKIIPRDTLKEILAEKLPLNIFYLCEIPKRIRIFKGEQLLDRAKLSSIIVRFVYENTPYIKGEKRIRDISTPEYIVLRKGERLYIHSIKNKFVPGYNSISFIVLKHNKKLRTRPGKFFLDVWQEIPCAIRPLNIGEILTPDKITFVKKNLAYLPKNLWDGHTGPWRIKVPIGRLQPISFDKLEPLPTVQKGQKIKLIFEGTNVYLSVIAQSLEDGKIGDIIKVINLQSRRIVYAKIISKDIAKVE